MLPVELFRPCSIAIVGASNDIHKPGGKVLANILAGGFDGKIYPVNPRETSIQGLRTFAHPADLPPVDLAIMAIPAQAVRDAIQDMPAVKNFIVFSAGFGETGGPGKKLEEELCAIIRRRRGTLIGPNSVGLMNGHVRGVFTEPIPEFDPSGCHLISGSGATACFILELAIPRGLRFSSVVSVGNSAQVGIEDLLEHLDESSDPSRVILLYMEKIDNPEKLLNHARSLYSKGCRIAAIKAGASAAGERAASSHTGALATPDTFVDALLRKAGIIRCAGREELVDVACALQVRPGVGKRFAVVTHAGGPGVMLTDALTKNGLEIPVLHGPPYARLLGQLHPGSSVSNPVDFLATGTPDHLEKIMNTIEDDPNIDALAVIFGTPGLVDVSDAYEVIDRKMGIGRKPIYTVLPSGITAHREVGEFVSRGRVYFPDEVRLADALGIIARTPPAAAQVGAAPPRPIHSKTEWLDEDTCCELLSEFGISCAAHTVVDNADAALMGARRIGFPVALKAAGLLHKSDTGGVHLHINSDQDVLRSFDSLGSATGRVMIQKMADGVELFVGAVHHPRFGHLMTFGLGGIFVEYLHDIQCGLAPLHPDEARRMVYNLRGRAILDGVRGRPAVCEDALVELLTQVSRLVESCPQILELDLNPVMASGDALIVVDARIRVAIS